MTIYNMTFTNSTSPVGIAVGINNATGGIIGIGLCLIIYFILIKGALDNNDNLPNSLLFSSLICSIISGILLGLQLIPDYILGINVLILVSAIFIKLLGGK